LFVFGPESRVCPSPPVTAVDGQQFFLSAVLHNTSVQYIDFCYLKEADDLILRLSLDQTKNLLKELQQVVYKSQKLNAVLIPSTPTEPVAQSTPSASALIERGLQDPNFQYEAKNMNNINNNENWNQSPFKESSSYAPASSPSEELQRNQLPQLKKTQQAFFTREHLELCIQALQQPGVELDPSVMCPAEHLEELFLKGFDKRSIITSEIYKTLKEKKINYVKEDLRRVLDNLVEEKKITKQQRVSKNQREYTVYNFGKIERKKNTLSNQLEKILLAFKKELFSYQDYLQEAENKKIDLEAAERYFDERRQEGDVTEPKEGKFKFLSD
jgi:hypothetical protein